MRQMAFKPATRQQAGRATSRRAASTRPRVARVVCSATPTEQDGLSRRQALLGVTAGAALAAAAPLALAPSAGAAQGIITVDKLGTFQRKAQLADFRSRAVAAIKEVISPEDAPALLRLILHDAGTYDAVTKTGGVDGSIALNSEELSRPENADLKPVVAKLAKAKAAIDAGDAAVGPISWADLMVLAARAATQDSWRNIKLGRAVIASGGETIAGPAFGADWPVRLGRVDSTAAGPGTVPKPDAPVEEIRAFLNQLNTKPGQYTGGLFAPKPPFWEKPGFVLWTAAAADPAAEEERFVASDKGTYEGIKVGYDRSRRTVTRTDYEVDFITFFTELTNVGAVYNKDAYLKPEVVQALELK